MQSGLSPRADILPLSDVESVGTTGETQDILQVSTDISNGVNDNDNYNGDNNGDGRDTENKDNKFFFVQISSCCRRENSIEGKPVGSPSV